jgi:hypothetical protein
LIKQLYEAYQVDLSESEVSSLYSACYYSEDIYLAQQFKINLFQTIARRAIKNQQVLMTIAARKSGRFREATGEQSQEAPEKIIKALNRAKKENKKLKEEMERVSYDRKQQSERFKSMALNIAKQMGAFKK